MRQSQGDHRTAPGQSHNDRPSDVTAGPEALTDLHHGPAGRPISNNFPPAVVQLLAKLHAAMWHAEVAAMARGMA